MTTINYSSNLAFSSSRKSSIKSDIFSIPDPDVDTNANSEITTGTLENLNNDQLDPNNYDHLIKIVLVGNTNVGKTTILKRFSDDDLSVNPLPTIGVDFRCQMVQILDKNNNLKTVKMQIWDTAGQERFRTITSTYYRGAQGVMLNFRVR